MGGRREVSIISHRSVTRSDLKQERSFFLGSVSIFLQLVVAINESRLDSAIADNEVYVPVCSIIRKDCNRSAAGVALYIRENLSYTNKQN